MNKHRNTPQRLTGKARATNHRSSQESKLERRRFALPIEQQRAILKEYRDRGLAYGRASHGVPQNAIERNHTQQKTMTMEDRFFSIPKPEHGIQFIDHGTWKSGTAIMFAVADRADGRESCIALIYYEFDTTAQRALFRAYDYKGNLIVEPNESLGSVKTQIMSARRELVAQMELDERMSRPPDPLDGTAVPAKDPHAPVPSPYAAEAEATRDKKHKRSRAIRSRTANKSRSR